MNQLESSISFSNERIIPTEDFIFQRIIFSVKSNMQT